MTEVDVSILSKRVDEVLAEQVTIKKDLAQIREGMSSLIRQIDRLAGIVSKLNDEIILMKIEIRAGFDRLERK